MIICNQKYINKIKGGSTDIVNHGQEDSKQEDGGEEGGREEKMYN